MNKAAEQVVSHLATVPSYFSNLLDHGKERLIRIARLLCTQVSPTMYQVASLVQEDAVRGWQMRKNKVVPLLPRRK